MSDIKIPVQNRAIEKRNRLIEAAKTIFNKKGYHGTYIKDITSEAGISVGLFYKYFSDKDDIYTEVIKVIIEQELCIVNEFKDTMKNEEPSWTIINEYIKNRIRTIKFHNIIAEFHTVFKGNQQNEFLINDAKLRYLDVIREILLNIFSDMTDEKLKVNATMMWRTIYGNIIEIEKIDNESEKGIYIDNLTDMVSKYLGI